MRWIFKAAAIFTFAISIAILYILIKDALAFFIDVPKASLWEIGWFPRRGMFDLLTLFYGSLIVGLIAMLVAAPIGLGSAVYLSEYAHPRVRRVLKPTLELLASIPSVVLGYFAISFINPNLVTRFFPSANHAFTLLAAGLAVGLLTTPLVASVAEDALRAVPRELREASFGIGARRSTTAVRVVFPAAISGIMAALLLGIARAVGETMVVAIAAGAVGGGLRTLDPLGPGQTLTAAMAALGLRLRSGRRQRPGLPEPVLPRLPLVRVHPGLEPHGRPARPSSPRGVLMTALSTPATIGGRTATQEVERQLRGQQRHIGGTIFFVLLFACLLFAMLALVTLLVDIIRRAEPVLTDHFGDFLTSGTDSSSASSAGVWQGIKGTVMIAAIVALVAFPLGVACAVYLEEYAPRSRLARFARINVRNLAGVPSIVYGMLGFAIFVKYLRRLHGWRHRLRRRPRARGAGAADRGHHRVGGIASRARLHPRRRIRRRGHADGR